MSKDKVPTQLPVDPAQLFMRKVDRRDKLVQTFRVILLSVVVVINLVGLIRIQYVINQNQESAVQARQSNIERQTELKNYIKCVVLLRFTSTPDSLTTQRGVTDALDKCAAIRNM